MELNVYVSYELYNVHYTALAAQCARTISPALSGLKPKEVTCACHVELKNRERVCSSRGAQPPSLAYSCSAQPRKCLNLV